MTDLFQLIDTNLLALITPFYDVSGYPVRDWTFFARAVEPTAVNVVLVIVTRPLDSFACHVSSGVFPHRVEARPISPSCMNSQVFTMTELPSGNQSGSSGTLGRIL